MWKKISFIIIAVMLCINSVPYKVEAAKNSNVVSGFSDGLAVFQDKKTLKLGYVDKDYNIVIPAKYDSAAEFRNGRGLVYVILSAYTTHDKYMLIDKEGNEINTPLEIEATISSLSPSKMSALSLLDQFSEDGKKLGTRYKNNQLTDDDLNSTYYYTLDENGNGVVELNKNTDINSKQTHAGKLKDGEQNGQETVILPDGEIYVGSFKNGKANGQGTLTWPDGKKYVGEFKNGYPNGHGTVTFSNGDNYVGEWKDNKRNGQGTYTWADGATFVGEYKDDNRNGQGVFTDANGNILQSGTWKDGIFQNK